MIDSSAIRHKVTGAVGPLQRYETQVTATWRPCTSTSVALMSTVWFGMMGREGRVDGDRMLREAGTSQDR